jgi:hypothetical protein
MAKVTYKDVSGTSFHNTIITTTVVELKKLIGNPYGNNTGEDKVNFVWDCETEDGDVFTIYDWKEYREISEDEPIEFHIGAISKQISEQAKQEINDKRN